MTGGQRGKFITVYTSDIDEKEPGKESNLVVTVVSSVLNGHGLSGPDIADEKNLAPMIFTRYSFDYTKSGE